MTTPKPDKMLLLEFYGTDRYAYELVSASSMEVDKMDAKWQEQFGVPMTSDPYASWEITDCLIEPAFTVSVTAEGWSWSVCKKLWFNEQYKVIYIKKGISKSLEDALMEAMSAFEEMLIDSIGKEKLDSLLEGLITDENISD